MLPRRARRPGNCLRSSLVLLLQSLEIFEGVDVGRAPGVGAVDPVDSAVAHEGPGPGVAAQLHGLGPEATRQPHGIAGPPVVTGAPDRRAARCRGEPRVRGRAYQRLISETDAHR